MDDRQFGRIAKALADPRRFSILETVAAAGEMSCGEITERFPVGQSTISHHLRVLEQAGVMRVRRQGQHGYFSARADVIECYVRELQRRLRARDPAPAGTH